jgi:outer membrane protein OmpA-like peptidoglycan-associated protein
MVFKSVVVAMLLLPVGVRAEPDKQSEVRSSRVAPVKLGDGKNVAAPPAIESTHKVEALGPRPAFQPANVGSAPKVARLGHPHRAKLASFDPALLKPGTAAGKQVDELARSYKTNLKWDAFTVDAYAAALPGRSDADTLKLAQKSADDVRAYLVKHGVPADNVVALGHSSNPSGATAANIDVSVTTCDDVTIACRTAEPAK